MFKKFFDTVKLNAQVKVMREALNTIATSSELCLELMEHPMKRQDNIKELLKDINKLAQDGGEVNVEQLKKELARHQRPLAGVITSLLAVLQYQKSLIPQHIIDPLIESVKEHIISELDKLKCNT